MPGHRVVDVTRDDQRGDFKHLIHEGGVGVRYQDHVGLVDLLKTANGRTVKAHAFLKQLFAQFPGGHAEMLPRTGQVGEPQIHHVHLFAHFHYVCDCL